MSRPTLVQSLLKQPSQTYRNADAPQKEYHSTRQHMMRIAADTARGIPATSSTAAPPRMPSAPATERRRPPKPPPVADSDDESSNSEPDIFFTPNTSPRTSMASSAATIRRPSRRSLHADSHLPLQLPPDISAQPSTSSATSAIAVPSTRTPSTAAHSQTRAKHSLSSASSLSSTSLQAHSLFSDYIGSGESTLLTSTHTPSSTNTSAHPKDAQTRSTTTDARRQASGSSKSIETTSSSTTTPKSPSNPTKSTTTPDAAAKKSIGSKKATYAHLGVANGDSNASTKAKDNEQKAKPVSSISPNGAPISPTNNASTSTSPKKSASPRQPHTFSAFASISASTTITTPTAPVTPSSATPTRPAANSNSKDTPSPSRRPSSTPNTDNASRMAVPTSTSTSTATKPTQPQPKHQRTQSTPSASSTTSAKSTSSTPKPHPPEPPSSPPPRPPSTLRKKPPIAIAKPGSTLAPFGGMDALLEEDEDGPLTPRMESRELNDYDSSAPGGGWDWATADTLSNPSTSSPSTHARSLRHTTSPSARQRARAHSADRDSTSSTSSTSTSRAYTAPKTLTAEVQSLLSSLPTGTPPSKGTQGYTALILPRAPPPTSPFHSNGRLHKSRPAGLIPGGRIDLTLDGVAQTTMASVEVVRGLGARSAAGVLGKLGFGRRRTSPSSGGRKRGPVPVPLPTLTGARAESNGGVSATGNDAPAAMTTLAIEQTTPLSFTSYRAPPTHIPSESVLVQVWAVGLDAVDARLVGSGFGRGGAVFRPQSAGARRPSGTEAEADTEAEDTGDDQEQSEYDQGRNGNWNANANGGDSTAREDTEDDAWDEPSTASASRKGPLAALGHSISLRLSRGGSGRTKDNLKDKHTSSPSKQSTSSSKQSASPPKQAGHQRSASAVVSSPRTNVNNAKSTPTTAASAPNHSPRPDISLPKRSFSLKRNNTAPVHSTPASAMGGASSPYKTTKEKEKEKEKEKKASGAGVHVADVGYIPGRSFVGRVLECGWDVSEEVVRKGEWVIGLLDVRKGGALTEFIVVDRHRIHRVPYPRMDDTHNSSLGSIPTSTSALALDELALLPLCGLLAYRAVRTFVFAFSSRDGYPAPGTTNYTANSNAAPKHVRPLLEHDQGHRRRALVLRGHDGTGAMAVQMLVQRGWRVSVHVPFSSVPAHTPQEVSERFMHEVEQRAREWGADEVIFDDGEEGGMDDGCGAAVRVLESLREDGDIFDAVLDTVGGKVVWAAAERLLKFQGNLTSGSDEGKAAAVRRRGIGQFTTLIGHTPERVIPTARDNFRAGLRALRMGSANGAGNGHTVEAGGGNDGKGKVGYAWVSVAQDVDWEGDDVAETLGAVLRLALEERVRPLTEGLGMDGRMQSRVVPFEQAPYLFVDNGPFIDGGTVVVTVA